jgi:beta-galactosidase
VCAIHTAPCASLHVPYSVPGENGGRSNTQWIEFFSSKKQNQTTEQPLPKIQIRCNPLCTFSAQRYSTEDLATSLHTSELKTLIRDSLCVNIDPYMMGLGSDDCWSTSLSDQFILTPKVYNFQFAISAREESSASTR